MNVSHMKLPPTKGNKPENTKHSVAYMKKTTFTEKLTQPM